MAVTENRLVRQLTVALLCALVPLGFGCKWYGGPAHAWVNNSLSGVLYEIFWCLVVLAVAPRLDARYAAAGVFCVTSVLEALQLWHPAWLEALRDTFLGAVLLGTTFVWSDFPHYAAGCLAGWAIIRAVQYAAQRGASRPRAN